MTTVLRSHRKTIFETLGRGPIHPFPARMAPGIALDALSGLRQPLRVLDPMAGSGTVLAVARAKGHRALGVDLDPLAVLLANVWTRTLDPCQVRAAGEEALSRARRTMRSLRVSQAYPERCDSETRAFMRYWFDDYARRQLASLALAIGRVGDDSSRDALWCAFSRLILTKQAGASLALDLSHSRPHKAFERGPLKPLRRFASAVDLVVENCPQAGGESVGPPSRVRAGDARSLDLPGCSIDIVLTSPPYLNAIDYMRCSKFSLVWMGYNVAELRRVRARSVGTEVSCAEALDESWIRGAIRSVTPGSALSSREHALLATYAWDMGRALSEVSRVLRPGGRAVYVVGESTIRRTFVRNARLVIAAAERHGLRLVSRHSRELPPNRRYLPPPRRRSRRGALLDGRMRREVVVEFRKFP
jgi:DNA modification methylase